jgi:ABC-2 type transport system permease protein
MSVADDSTPVLVPGAFVPVFPRRWTRPGTMTGVPTSHLSADLRLFRSELALVFGRRRNQAALAVLAAVPILIGVAVRWSSPPSRGGGEGPAFLSLITGNGLFVALTALSAALPLFLPLAVSAIAADSIAGEAGSGTLRYLLTVPVGRARLLGVKFAAVVVFALAAVSVIAVVGTLTGLILFGGGPATLLSGATVGFGSGLLRLALVVGYVTFCLVGLAGIGLFVSTLTEQPIGATIGIVVLAVTSQILDAVPQLHVIQPFLPTHHWLDYGELLRDPIGFSALVPGLLSAAIYALVFGTAAWARFGAKDVTS